MIRPMITVTTLLELNEDLFEDLSLPTRPFTDRGYDDLYLDGWDLDKDTLVNNLLMETAELNVLYTDPVFMQWAIRQWSLKERPVWQAEYETLFYKYNPIWNKDGQVTHTANHTETPGVQETETKTYNLQDAADHTRVNSGQITTVGSEDRTDQRTIHDEVDEEDTTKVAAFDSAAFQNREQTTIDRTDHTTDNVTSDKDTSETVTDSTSQRNTGTDTRTGTESTVHSRLGSNLVTDSYADTETGNIGVTSSQELIQKERDLALFNIYDMIIESFKCRFCLLVY